MRTSSSQFELMVTFMQEHGDLSKPSTNARGRMTTIRRWEELTTFLNSDGSGDTKTTEKWKKVWSDLKNNTKKKAARIHRAASGTGGGLALTIKLTDLEQRVLNLIGMQAATGLAVAEGGFSQEINIERNMPDPVEEIRLPSPSGSTQAEDIQIIEIAECTDSLNEPGPSRRDSRPQPPVQMPPPTSPPPHHVEAVVIVENAENRISPVPPPHADATQAQPALSGQTTPRRSIRPRVSRTRPSPRRLVRPTQTEQAAQHFLHSDEEWRKFKIQQHRDNVEMARDKNRVREMEVETQRTWLALGSRVLDLVDKVVNKFCKD
ncbi:uncharacterized protein LOC126381076 isoform X2 [Pectinophora gossypiella]|uniref:uncharacterized protein LOC126381076 isoform X2 n=1 Tax=Pectinophora gossypiella TaxID=13191 RepID=UPI00214F34E4|nr:uncharacterized protein LOC126381076 isoform X2 [Pectinophora gossypiella]